MSEYVDYDVNPAANLFGLLAPGMMEQAEALRSGKAKLVHYTSAENAMKIIDGEQFWLRNVRCMNDYSEVQHGIDLLLRVFNENDDARINRLVSILDQNGAKGAEKAIVLFNKWIPSLPDEVFIGCLSLFQPGDNEGRLSMWRAYGSARGGVALVLSVTPFLAETNQLNAYSLPVAYLNDQQFADAIDNCLSALESNKSLFSNLSEDEIHNNVFWWLLALSVSLKHPAFAEEMEWRVMYIPSMFPSKVIKQCVETISSFPQIVQKVPLIDDPENGLIAADIPHLLEQIIIGPSDYPKVLRDAFADTLASKGVENPQDKLVNSFIPIR